MYVYNKKVLPEVNLMAMTIILYAILIVLIIRVFFTQKSLKKRRQLIEVVKSIHEDDFFDKLDSFEKQMQDDPEILNKGRIIGLWGMAYRKETDDFEKTLNDLDLNVLIKEKNGKYSIDDNEDSFFYIMLTVPELLYFDDQNDLRLKVNQKIEEQRDKLQGQLIYAVYQNVNKYYDHEDDRGLAFYQKVLNGDYADYSYNKQFIGLYKDVVNAQAYAILREEGKENTLEDAQNMLDQFEETTIGMRWLKDLGIRKEEDSEETDTDTEVFDMSSDDQKEEHEIKDAEIVEKDDSDDKKESV